MPRKVSPGDEKHRLDLVDDGDNKGYYMALRGSGHADVGG